MDKLGTLYSLDNRNSFKHEEDTYLWNKFLTNITPKYGDPSLGLASYTEVELNQTKHK